MLALPKGHDMRYLVQQVLNIVMYTLGEYSVELMGSWHSRLWSAVSCDPEAGESTARLELHR